VPTGTIKSFEAQSTGAHVLRGAFPASKGRLHSALKPTDQKPANRVVEIRRRSTDAEREGVAMRGILVAFAFEFVTGLGVYTMWHAWHLIR
jgi:hypothetical protein